MNHKIPTHVMALADRTAALRVGYNPTVDYYRIQYANFDVDVLHSATADDMPMFEGMIRRRLSGLN